MYTHSEIDGESTAHVVPRHPVTVHGQPVHRTPEEVREYVKQELANDSRNGRAIWTATCIVGQCSSLAAAKRTELIPKSCTNDTKRKAYLTKCQKAWKKWERSVGKNGKHLFGNVCFLLFSRVCTDVVVMLLRIFLNS